MTLHRAESQFPADVTYISRPLLRLDKATDGNALKLRGSYHPIAPVVNLFYPIETQTQALPTYIFLGSPSLVFVEDSSHRDSSFYNRFSKFRCLYLLDRNLGKCLGVITHFGRSQHFQYKHNLKRNQDALDSKC